MKTVIAILGMIFLVGCSTMSRQESEILQAQLSQPTFKIECPTTGCNFSNFEYHDPNKRIDMPTNGYDVANNAIGSLKSVLLGAAPYYALTKAFDHMNNGTTTNTTTNTTSSDSSDNSSYNSSDDNSSYVDSSTTSSDDNSSYVDSSTTSSDDNSSYVEEFVFPQQQP